jgi:hypothetical protein
MCISSEIVLLEGWPWGEKKTTEKDEEEDGRTKEEELQGTPDPGLSN